jgi:transmembrane sensor
VYRSRVARRDYRGAYAVLSRNPALAGDTVEELLVAADVARLSNHPSEAVPYLQRIIREHPRDERAPLAAFTLGRTLSGLGRTEEAMNMFGRVQSSWPKSALAEDALLRQAEAASQLGDIGAARRIAEQYDRAYPNGRRRSEVRRHARLE